MKSFDITWLPTADLRAFPGNPRAEAPRGDARAPIVAGHHRLEAVFAEILRDDPCGLAILDQRIAGVREADRRRIRALTYEWLHGSPPPPPIPATRSLAAADQTWAALFELWNDRQRLAFALAVPCAPLPIQAACSLAAPQGPR